MSDGGAATGGDRLDPYRRKRAFDITPEPDAEAHPQAAGQPGALRFVVQKHDARRLHYDFRLEAEGVLISWAVPKGPSYDPKVKRLAVHVEDHPLDYRTFEGVIPEAQYGAGTVIVWDEGTYDNITSRDGREVGIVDAVRNGHVSIRLAGTKLKGGWSLTRTAGHGGRESWILVKRTDEHADPQLDVTVSAPASVRTGRTLDEIGADRDSDTWTRGRATWRPPMLAQLVKGERRATGDDAAWRYERKLDGLRCIAVRNGGQVELWSRNHLPFNGRFPELVAALGSLGVDNFVLDGEIVAFDDRGRTSFGLLQGSDRTARPVYCAFDLLHLLGQDTTGLPLPERQALLAQALAGAPSLISTVDGVAGDAETLKAQACADGWEGLIAKRVDAPYRSGRSPDWRKIKCSASQELVIGGWTDPSGARTGFGAVLVGWYDEAGRLHYAGKVGTGFDDRLLRELHRNLVSLASETCPFAEPPRIRGAHWVVPELVGAVNFTEWTGDGRLRHPSFQGLRVDKDPRSVRRET